jgi:hypothetical protein
MIHKQELQFNFKKNKYEIIFLLEIPNIKFKKKLNFRIFSIKNHDDKIIFDPTIPDSNYIFGVEDKFFNKKMYFILSFNKKEFEKIKELQLGLCDEDVRWINKDIFVSNFFYKNDDKKEDVTEVTKTLEQINLKMKEQVVPELIKILVEKPDEKTLLITNIKEEIKKEKKVKSSYQKTKILKK